MRSSIGHEKNSLIVHLMGRHMGFRFLEARLKKLWEDEGHIRVIDLSDNYFMVSFSHEGDYKFAF